MQSSSSNVSSAMKPSHRNAITSTLSVALLCFAAGCHSKTKATPENFIAGLNANFLNHSECLFPDPPRFPYGTSDKTETKQFDSLVKAQLLTVAQEPAIKVSRYTVTTTGARYAPRFCYGHRTVTAVDSFTPPAQANGFPETRVTYRYTVQDVPVWAKTPDVQAAFPKMAQATSGESTAQATLAGTLAGWQVPE